MPVSFPFRYLTQPQMNDLSSHFTRYRVSGIGELFTKLFSLVYDVDRSA